MNFSAARLTLSALLASCAATSASAQDIPTGPVSLSGGVDLVSEYRFRGLSRSGGDVAVQPHVTISHANGLYVGGWGSNIDDARGFGDVELNLYGGYGLDVAPGTALDLGLTYYWHPDAPAARGASDYAEANARLSYMLGPVEASGSLGYAWDQAALGDDNLRLGVDLAAAIPTTPVTLKASLGRNDGGLAALAPGQRYWDWSIGATTNIGPFVAGVQYVDTDIPMTGDKARDKFYDAGVLLTLGLYF
ncbi:TorF family putative porin [Sphingopyxis sp. MWB1]|uniref:TorF family putative porin n=1 Tax=Sphingopyxis sp. MWB1 TaxID=1537715 RepID=UPI000519F5D3|nr:TorF family putative porin [Sphingopyxis sp. MWB1]